MEKKIYHILTLLVASLLLVACDSGSFKVEGDITGLKGTVVRVIFRGDSGVINEPVTVDKKGHFGFKGMSAQPIIVTLLNVKGDFLTTLVATNGDHLKVKGDAGKPMGLKVKGNKLNEDWQLFRDEHAAFYTDPNPSRLDAAIEKYVRENPADMLSTVLLVSDYSDYSDRAKVNKMLKSIDAKARPESLTMALGGASEWSAKQVLPRLTTLNLVKHGGGFEEIKLTDRVSLLFFWANPQTQRDVINRQLDAVDDAVHVVDVLTESDSLKWHKTIAGEDRAHYWAPGGPLEQGIQLLHISSLPWYAVTDSTGLVTYSGPDLKAALDKVTMK